MPPTIVLNPTVIQAAGNMPKIIKEFVGRVNSGDTGVSIARMVSPEGWVEPAAGMPSARPCNRCAIC